MQAKRAKTAPLFFFPHHLFEIGALEIGSHAIAKSSHPQFTPPNSEIYGRAGSLSFCQRVKECASKTAEATRHQESSRAE